MSVITKRNLTKNLIILKNKIKPRYSRGRKFCPGDGVGTLAADQQQATPCIWEPRKFDFQHYHAS